MPSNSPSNAPSHVFDVTTEGFQTDVLEKSLTTPVLLDFWAEWCGPCKQFGPLLEKLAAEYNGAFVLAKVDVDAQQQLAGYFQIRSVPTVMLVKEGQVVDGFPGVIPDGQLRQFLAQHGIEPGQPAEPEEAAPPTPAEEVARLRAESAARPDDDSLRLDLALALARNGDTAEASQLLDALPANLGTDERARNAGVLIANAAALQDAPARAELERRIAADPADLTARHLLGLRLLGDGEVEAALEQFFEMLRRDRNFEDGLPQRALTQAFDVITDAELVARYRRQMALMMF